MGIKNIVLQKSIELLTFNEKLTKVPPSYDIITRLKHVNQGGFIVAFNLKPKEEKFFEYLVESAKLLKDCADVLHDAMESKDGVEKHLKEIDKLEQQVDEVTERIINKLNKSFITPLDREDIYAIAQKLDDVADYIQGIIQRMHLYNTGLASDGAIDLAKIIVKSTRQMEKAFDQLPTLKKHRLKLQARCGRIIALETEGDRLYREEVGKLFRECKDPIELIKWKEILTSLEETLDICEDIANLLKGIVLKYA